MSEALTWLVRMSILTADGAPTRKVIIKEPMVDHMRVTKIEGQIGNKTREKQ